VIWKGLILTADEQGIDCREKVMPSVDFFLWFW